MAKVMKEHQLVYYAPLPASGGAPPPLAPCSDKLPWEKKAEAEKKREEARRKQLESQKSKKKGLINTLGAAVVTVASATVDAISVIQEDFKDTQSPTAPDRFKKYFPGFPQEMIFAEYETRWVVTPESVLGGRLYITSTFFCFSGEQEGHYSVIMIPLRNIVSIQKAVLSKPPEHVPVHYPPQFNIIIGGELPPTELEKYPKVDSLVVYTNDNMQHMVFGIKHFKEMFAVLDYCWRNPSPLYQAIPGAISNSIPNYATPQYLLQSQQLQLRALQELSTLRLEQKHREQFQHQHQQHLEQQQLASGISSLDIGNSFSNSSQIPSAIPPIPSRPSNPPDYYGEMKIPEISHTNQLQASSGYYQDAIPAYAPPRPPPNPGAIPSPIPPAQQSQNFIPPQMPPPMPPGVQPYPDHYRPLDSDPHPHNPNYPNFQLL